MPQTESKLGENEIQLLWRKAREAGMPRRKFLVLLAGSGAAAVLAACAPSTTTITTTPTPKTVTATTTVTATPPPPFPTPSATAKPSPTPTPTPTPAAIATYFSALQFFDRYTAAIVHAAAGRIIPGTAQDPGAKEAGVVIFIDETLEGYDQALQPLYQANVPAMDTYAQAKYQKGFADLTDTQQDDILSNMEKNSDEAKTYLPNPAGFFAALVTHTRQGMFGDPIYGGNANSVGWKLIGHPGIVFGHDPAQQKCDVNFTKEYMGSREYYAQHAA